MKNQYRLWLFLFSVRAGSKKKKKQPSIEIENEHQIRHNASTTHIVKRWKHRRRLEHFDIFHANPFIHSVDFENLMQEHMKTMNRNSY